MSKMLKGDKARAAMARGISAVAESIRGTLGPDAFTVLYKAPSGRPFVVNDGVSVVRQIKPEDPFEELGASLMREVAEEAQKASGDGTTTATIMAEAMCLQALKEVEDHYWSPKQLKQSLRDSLNIAVSHIEEWAEDVSEDTLENVATISANGDNELGKVISDAFKVVGETGTIVMVDALVKSPTLDFIKGMKISSGAASQHLMMNKQEMKYLDSIVVITDETINDFTEVIPALQDAVEKKKPLVLICGNISKIALDTLTLNAVQGKVEATVLVLPGQGEQKVDIAGDIACRAGAKQIMAGIGERIKDYKPEWAGNADVIVRKTSSVLIPLIAETDQDVSDREGIMRDVMEGFEHDWDKRVMADRIANLKGQVATISLSANTEAEGMEMKMRLDDSINATRAALQSGVVKGGGFTHHRLIGTGNITSDILIAGLVAVPRTLVDNSAEPIDYTSWVENIGDDVQDPVSVVCNSLKAAVSITELLLTTDTLIVEE